MNFGPTDWWYWGFKKGQCGSFIGQEVGKDASTQLTHHANMTIPLFDSRVYFTHLISIKIYPLSNPDPTSPSGHRLFFSSIPLPFHPCLQPEEMNYNNQSIRLFGIELKPTGKLLVNYFVAYTVLLFDFKAYPCHTLELSYGIPNFTMIPSEL